MRCGDWRTEREMRGKRREDGREKREEKNERQQTLDSRACWMQTLKTFEQIWKSLTGLSRTLLWFAFPAHDNHTVRAHQKRANTFIHRVFIWVSVRIFFGTSGSEQDILFTMATVMQKIKDIEDEVMMMRIPFFPFLSSWTHVLVFAFECSFVFLPSQILNCVFMSFMSLLLLLLFLFLFPTCRGRDEKGWLRWRDTEERHRERGY